MTTTNRHFGARLVSRASSSAVQRPLWLSGWKWRVPHAHTCLGERCGAAAAISSQALAPLDAPALPLSSPCETEEKRE